MIFDNPFAPDEEGPFAPVDDSLQFGRRARVARLPLTRGAGQTYLGSPVAEQRALAAGPTPERAPLGGAPPDQAAAERQRLAGQWHALGDPPQPGKFHWYDYVLGAFVPRVENMLAARRGQKLQDYLTQRSKILGDISTERTLGMLGGPEAAQEWTPISGTNVEVNRKTGETKLLAGVTAPAAKGTPQEQAFSELAKKEGAVQAYKDVLGMAPEKGVGSPTAHITRMENGRPMLYGWNAKSQKYDIPLGQAPPTFAETQLSDVVVLPTPDGMKAFGYDKRTNTLHPINIPPSAGAGAGAPLPKDAQKELDTSMSTARGANVRLDVMQQAEPLALQGDQQAMLNILANHIGMTLGLQKGARITQAMYNEAMASAPITGRLQAHFDNRGYLTGVVLTPDQIKQMLRLGDERRLAEWRNVYATGKQYGLSDDQALGNIPSDIRPQATGGAGAGFSGGPAPASKKKPWENYK